jgi:hypothetical protein
LHQRESLFDYLRKFNNESGERNEIKLARYKVSDVILWRDLGILS